MTLGEVCLRTCQANTASTKPGPPSPDKTLSNNHHTKKHRYRPLIDIDPQHKPCILGPAPRCIYQHHTKCIWRCLYHLTICLQRNQNSSTTLTSHLLFRSRICDKTANLFRSQTRQANMASTKPGPPSPVKTLSNNHHTRKDQYRPLIDIDLHRSSGTLVP